MPRTRDLARHLLVSENAVQDHLKSTVTKTATRNRAAWLARAPGT
jgi:DNA-binding CsgD family transcriptional regulator